MVVILMMVIKFCFACLLFFSLHIPHHTPFPITAGTLLSWNSLDNNPDPTFQQMVRCSIHLVFIHPITWTHYDLSYHQATTTILFLSWPRPLHPTNNPRAPQQSWKFMLAAAVVPLWLLSEYFFLCQKFHPWTNKIQKTCISLERKDSTKN